jgi:CRISPR-associated endonuclease/helicase Cas3
MDVKFEKNFQMLTGKFPFPWQRALYERLISDRPDNIPTSCNLPTGLGKTSVVAIWLIARITHPSKIPRRLVYVVNRRTVVDQTTTEVERLRETLPKLDPALGKLAISTLRGQFADNREWSADPSRIAVVCGTVDMIGSRLLFSGYGCGFKTKPLHAGFLGQDVLLIHDEAHLEPAFQSLLISIQREQERRKEFLPFRVMELSATSRGKGEVFKLTPEDEADAVVKQRIHAKKTMIFHCVDEEKKLSEKLVELALAHKDSGQAILIFVRTVDDLTKIVAKLPEGQVQQLTGTMRGLEREGLVGDPVFNRFLPESSRPTDVPPAEGTAYLVCTSAGEVGVNISADHLVCDLSPLDSMAQRFGRVNRFGFCDGTRIEIIHPTVFKNDDKLDSAREKTLALLKTLNASASPSTIGNLMHELSDEERKAAFTPEPNILPASHILFDAWALTTIRDRLPGRPPVADYLHGINEWEPPQTFVAWRNEVWELRQPFGSEREQREFQKYATELLEDYPLKSHELLRDRTSRVLIALKKLTAAPTTPVWVLDDGQVLVTTLEALTDGNTKVLDDRTILLPPQAGGLKLGKKGDSTGLFDGSEKYDPERKYIYDVGDEWHDDHGPLRKRQWDNDTKPPGMRLEREIVFENPEDEDAEPARIWYWFVRPAGAEANERGVKDYPLQPHLNEVQAAAETFVSNLPLDVDIHDAVILAAKYHDLGKDRERWQRGIGNTDYPAQKWAKSGKRRAATERSTYRHEFGSLLDVQAQPEFANLSGDAQDLALHLIASHHGRARPHFPIEEVFDDNYPGDKASSLGLEIPRRYARLQRKYGRWGLAYLESLVRAADYVVSAKASRTEEVKQ